MIRIEKAFFRTCDERIVKKFPAKKTFLIVAKRGGDFSLSVELMAGRDEASGATIQFLERS
jgi:hypothetical protein